MKKLILLSVALLFGVLLLLGASPSAQAAKWAEPYLQNLVNREVMKGDKNGDLYPDRLITRAEFAAMVNRAFGFTQKSNKTFSDVKATDWYAADISIAANQGYMEGDGKGANPKGNLTRQEAVAVLCRALKIPAIEQNDFKLNDDKSFSNWSRGYINAAVDRNFVSGYPDSTFRPKNNITRGEAAKMLSEAAGEIVTADRNNARGTLYSNVTLASSGVTVSGATIMNDLYLTEGVGLGYVSLKDVTANGEMIISGAGESNVGESSVVLSDCTVTDLTVDVAKQKILTLKTDRSTTVRNALIKSSTYLEELSDNYEGFDRVTINGPTGTFLSLTGNFGDIRIMSAGAQLGLYKGQTNSITIDETAKDAKIFLEKDTITDAIYFDTGATVTGTGRIKNVLINNDGVVIDQLPENIYIRPGVTAKINGKVMGSLDAEMDAMDPEFMAGYPMVDKIQPVSFNAYYKTNKPGKIYYAVYAEDMPAPTKDDLIAKNNPPKNALKSGNLSSIPDKEGSVTVSGLKSGTKYVLYSLFVDLRNKSSDIELTRVETVDNVVPTLLSGYPKLAEAQRYGAKIDLLPNKNTEYYWAVLPEKSIAPTADQLYVQKVSGSADQGVDKNGRMNEINSITISGLLEFKTYDFYVILRDPSDNMSKTPYKLSFTTKDVTPPVFKPTDIYPKTGVVTDTAIPIEYMVSEACTVYWSAAKEGTDVLPKVGGVLDKTSQKAKDIVKGGTNALKFGKSAAAKENTKYTFSISGLEKQMPYDIYFMLEDKNENTSEIFTLVAKTKDSVAPTVVASSEQTIGGNFSVESPIILTFSEIVCGAQIVEGEYLRLAEIFKKTPVELRNYIKLIDTSKVPNVTNEIDWTKATVLDVGTQTVITLPPPAFKTPLANNNAYRFELSFNSAYYLRDTSKNQMKATTQIPFKTVPPLTYFSEVQNFNAARYDAAFYINPQAQNTGENINFDIMLRSDHYIVFELYEGTDITDESTMKLVEKDGKKEHVLEKDYATRFTDYFVKKSKYKDIKSAYYAIKLKKVDTTDLTGPGTPLTANVNLKMNAVIGNEKAITPLPGEAAGFDARLKKALSDNSISSVTAPKDPFELTVSLVDNVPPARVGDPTFEPGDRQVLMGIQTDKGCTVYYYVRPKTIDDVAGKITDANVVRTQRSDPTLGIAAGSFAILDNRADPTQHTIKGLLPPEGKDPTRDYVIYYYMQGKAATPSEVFSKEIYTIPIKPPHMVEDTFQSKAGGGMLTLVGTWADSECTMWYVVYPSNVYATTDPTPAQITNPTDPDKTIKHGSIKIEGKNQLKFELSVDELNYKNRYNIFVVAQKSIGAEPAGDFSVVYSKRGLAPLDDIKPAILSGYPKTVTETVTEGKNPKSTGSVTVSFTEGLYWFNEGSLDAPKPMSVADLKGMLRFSQGAKPQNIDVKLIESGGGIPGVPADKCANYLSFSYTNISEGTSVSFGNPIGDKALNISGNFTMTFHLEDEKGQVLVKPYWDAEFTP